MAIATALVLREFDVPLWIVHVVRVVEVALTIFLILATIESLSGRPGGTRPPWSRWLLAGTLLWLLRALLITSERWSEPLKFGGAPTTIVIELFVLAGWVSRMRHEHGRRS